MGAGSVVTAISYDEFETIINKHKIVFVDFWTEWCGPCKHFAHVFETVANMHHKDILFASVNLEKEAKFSELFSIQSVPHLMVFKDGIAIYSESGSMPQTALKDLVEQALIVDMSEIHEQLEKKNNSDPSG